VEADVTTKEKTPMEYVPLQVPEHLYLRTLAFLAAEADEYEASAALVAENEQLRAVVHDQFEENGRLRLLLEEAQTKVPVL
jgi:hypothetical protein